MVKHKKNEEYTVTITDIGTNGEGIGHLEDGYTLFVTGALPQDVCLVRIIKAQKNYGYARLQKLLSASPHRITAECPAAGKCGGCQISALSYEAQLSFKENKVRELLSRIGGFSDEILSGTFHPIVGMELPGSSKLPSHFRNKSQFPVGTNTDGSIIMGFYSIHSHRIIPCDECLIGAPTDRAILNAVSAYMGKYHVPAYDESTHTGLIRHILIRTGYFTGEIQVCLVINGQDLPETGELVSSLLSLDLSDPAHECLDIVSVCTSSNTSDTNVILGNSFKVIHGRPYLTDMIGDITFRISPLSFFQVNPIQTQKLYRLALDAAALTGSETVWDLYCGIGTISLFLARHAARVFGVEIIPQAIENARENADINNISNATFMVGEAEKVLPDYYDTHPDMRADVIVVDPPRKGCDNVCLDTMLNISPDRIVYVSCDPATLARDLKYLCADGRYTLRSVTPVDMFPNSVHVETVVLLSQQRKADDYIEVEIDFDELDATSTETNMRDKRQV